MRGTLGLAWPGICFKGITFPYTEFLNYMVGHKNQLALGKISGYYWSMMVYTWTSKSHNWVMPVIQLPTCITINYLRLRLVKGVSSILFCLLVKKVSNADHFCTRSAAALCTHYCRVGFSFHPPQTLCFPKYFSRGLEIFSHSESMYLLTLGNIVLVISTKELTARYIRTT